VVALRSSGGELDAGEASGHRAGWIGLHDIIGIVLSFGGINVSRDALGQAAEATHHMVEGRLPDFLNIVGTYGSIIADLLLEGESNEDGQDNNRDGETGRVSEHGEEDDSDRSDSARMGDYISRSDSTSHDLQVDRGDLRWDGNSRNQN